MIKNLRANIYLQQVSAKSILSSTVMELGEPVQIHYKARVVANAHNQF